MLIIVNVVCLPSSLIIDKKSMDIITIKKIIKQENEEEKKKIVLRNCVSKLFNFFIINREFRLSKRLLRHYFHRKEFRRKDE